MLFIQKIIRDFQQLLGFYSFNNFSCWGMYLKNEKPILFEKNLPNGKSDLNKYDSESVSARFI